MEIETCSPIECEDDSRRVTGPFTQRPLPDFEETELADYEADDEAPAPVAAALFAKALSDQVMRTEADIAAVLHRFTVPLSVVMAVPGVAVPPLTVRLPELAAVPT